MSLKIIIRAVLTASVAISFLAGCNAVTSTVTGISVADNALASLAANDVPTACYIISVAEGYFNKLQSRISVTNQKRYQTAVSVINPICTNPPTNIVSALTTLNNAWMTVQAATKTN